MLSLEQLYGAGVSAIELGTVGVATVFVPTATVLLTLVIQVIWFMRLSTAQRDMTWKISKQGICLYDGSGNKVALPWNQVKRFSGPFIHLASDLIEFGLRMHRNISPLRKILP